MPSTPPTPHCTKAASTSATTVTIINSTRQSGSAASASKPSSERCANNNGSNSTTVDSNDDDEDETDFDLREIKEKGLGDVESSLSLMMVTPNSLQQHRRLSDSNKSTTMTGRTASALTAASARTTSSSLLNFSSTMGYSVTTNTSNSSSGSKKARLKNEHQVTEADPDCPDNTDPASPTTPVNPCIDPSPTTGQQQLSPPTLKNLKSSSGDATGQISLQLHGNVSQGGYQEDLEHECDGKGESGRGDGSAVERRMRTAVAGKYNDNGSGYEDTLKNYNSSSEPKVTSSGDRNSSRRRLKSHRNSNSPVPIHKQKKEYLGNENRSQSFPQQERNDEENKYKLQKYHCIEEADNPDGTDDCQTLNDDNHLSKQNRLQIGSMTPKTFTSENQSSDYDSYCPNNSSNISEAAFMSSSHHSSKFTTAPIMPQRTGSGGSNNAQQKSQNYRRNLSLETAQKQDDEYYDEYFEKRMHNRQQELNSKQTPGVKTPNTNTRNYHSQQQQLQQASSTIVSASISKAADNKVLNLPWHPQQKQQDSSSQLNHHTLQLQLNLQHSEENLSGSKYSSHSKQISCTSRTSHRSSVTGGANGSNSCSNNSRHKKFFVDTPLGTVDGDYVQVGKCPFPPSPPRRYLSPKPERESNSHLVGGSSNKDRSTQHHTSKNIPVGLADGTSARRRSNHKKMSSNKRFEGYSLSLDSSNHRKLMKEDCGDDHDQDEGGNYTRGPLVTHGKEINITQGKNTGDGRENIVDVIDIISDARSNLFHTKGLNGHSDEGMPTAPLLKDRHPKDHQSSYHNTNSRFFRNNTSSLNNSTLDSNPNNSNSHTNANLHTIAMIMPLPKVDNANYTFAWDSPPNPPCQTIEPRSIRLSGEDEEYVIEAELQRIIMTMINDTGSSVTNRKLPTSQQQKGRRFPIRSATPHPDLERGILLSNSKPFVSAIWRLKDAKDLKLEEGHTKREKITDNATEEKGKNPLSPNRQQRRASASAVIMTTPTKSNNNKDSNHILVGHHRSKRRPYSYDSFVVECIGCNQRMYASKYTVAVQCPACSTIFAATSVSATESRMDTPVASFSSNLPIPTTTLEDEQQNYDHNNIKDQIKRNSNSSRNHKKSNAQSTGRRFSLR